MPIAPVSRQGAPECRQIRRERLPPRCRHRDYATMSDRTPVSAQGQGAGQARPRRWPASSSSKRCAVRWGRAAIAAGGLDHNVQHGIMSSDQKHAVEDAVSQRRNILICGGTEYGQDDTG